MTDFDILMKKLDASVQTSKSTYSQRASIQNSIVKILQKDLQQMNKATIGYNRTVLDNYKGRFSPFLDKNRKEFSVEEITNAIDIYKTQFRDNWPKLQKKINSKVKSSISLKSTSWVDKIKNYRSPTKSIHR